MQEGMDREVLINVFLDSMLEGLRVPSSNVCIKERLGIRNVGFIGPIEVVHIRCIFQPQETMYMCRSSMLPFIPERNRREKVRVLHENIVHKG